MINGFAYKLTGAPWQVSNAKLNTLPTGRVQLQAITRIPGQPWVKSVAWIDVQPATSTTSSGSSGSSSTSSSAGSTTTGTGNTTTGNTTSSGSTSASGSTVDSSSTGWTQFTKASDTRVIYVSSSQGNDSNSGLSPQTPVKTVQKGLSLMRNGHADWLLFKRGDVFTQGLGYINLSGPSAAHPIVFGNYGDPSLPRPEFRVGTFINTFNGQHDHIAIVGLHLIDSQRDPSSPDYNSNVTDGYGIRWFSDNGSDLLIENCLIEWYRMGLVISKVNNLRLRRNVIRDCYSNGSKDSSGAFISYSNHVLIQGNVFDQNGYLSFVGGDRSVRNHDIYLYNCTYLTAQNNILARASSMGIKCKGEGAAAASHDIQITGNLFLGDTIGLTFGQNGEVNYSVQNIAVSHNVFAHLGGNVVLEDGSTASQALGVDTKSIANATFDHNIFVNTPDPGQRTVWALNVSSWRPQKQITMSYNIVSPTFKYSMGPLMSNKGATTFLDNTTITDPSLYVNANCSVASYDTSIGGPGSIASFLNEADKQCKSNWRPAYTAQKAVNYFAQQLSYVPND